MIAVILHPDALVGSTNLKKAIYFVVASILNLLNMLPFKYRLAPQNIKIKLLLFSTLYAFGNKGSNREEINARIAFIQPSI